MGAAFRKMFAQFFEQKLDAIIVGLDNSGKTTLMNVLTQGQPASTVPTIGMNVQTVKKGNVTLKCWDVSGQKNTRSQWAKVAKDCHAIVFVVDCAHYERLAEARQELSILLESRALEKKPILILANKVDIVPHVSEIDLIRELNLDYIVENPWVVIPCSTLKLVNIPRVVAWLMAQNNNKKLGN